MCIESFAAHVVQNKITCALYSSISSGLENHVCKKGCGEQSANDLEISAFVRNNGCHAAAKSVGRSLCKC
jgi:hypothetical protein